MHFGRSSHAKKGGGGVEALMISNVATSVVVFRVTVQQSWCRKSSFLCPQYPTAGGK